MRKFDPDSPANLYPFGTSVVIEDFAKEFGLCEEQTAYFQEVTGFRTVKFNQRTLHRIANMGLDVSTVLMLYVQSMEDQFSATDRRELSYLRDVLLGRWVAVKNSVHKNSECTSADYTCLLSWTTRFPQSPYPWLYSKNSIVRYYWESFHRDTIGLFMKFFEQIKLQEKYV
jgi:hypothetical protein